MQRFLVFHWRSGIEMATPTLIGEYHLRGFWGFCVPLLSVHRENSSGSHSGIVTRAFLAFSSLAPSSVDPLSPQRTCMWNTAIRLEPQALNPHPTCRLSSPTPYLHPLDPAHSPPPIVGGIYHWPFFLGHSVILLILKHKTESKMRAVSPVGIIFQGLQAQRHVTYSLSESEAVCKPIFMLVSLFLLFFLRCDMPHISFELMFFVFVSCAKSCKCDLLPSEFYRLVSRLLSTRETQE